MKDLPLSEAREGPAARYCRSCVAYGLVSWVVVRWTPHLATVTIRDNKEYI